MGNIRAIRRALCRIGRLLGYVAILGALGVLALQLGQGIAAVCAGEMTVAEMIEGLGLFLAGKGTMGE